MEMVASNSLERCSSVWNLYPESSQHHWFHPRIAPALDDDDHRAPKATEDLLTRRKSGAEFAWRVTFRQHNPRHQAERAAASSIVLGQKITVRLRTPWAPRISTPSISAVAEGPVISEA